MADKQKPYPPTPELNKMKAVHEKSQAIGEFLDIFLSERKMELCTYQTAGNNGKPKYRWKDGVTKSKLNVSVDREPRFEDVFNQDAENNPEYESWAEGYVPVHARIEKLLAEFFEIDLNKAEDERRAILAYIRGEEK